MSSYFDPTKNPPNAPAASTFFGAGDAGRTLQQPLTATQPQEKPTFGSGITTTLTFGSNPGTQMTQSSMIPSSVPTFNPPAATSNVNSSFGMTTSTPLSLGGSTIRTPGTGGFSVSTAAAPATSSTASTPAPSFGLPKSTAPGFKLGPSAANPATSSLSFGAPVSTPATTGFSLTGTGTTSSSLAPGFGSLSASTPATNVSLSNKLTLGSGATTGFNLTATTSLPAATSAQLSLGSAAPSTTSSLSGFSLPGTTSAATTGFNVGGATTAAISGGFSLNKTTTAAAVAPNTTQTTGTTQTTLGTTTTVSASSSSGQLGAINFCQLEESINKWTLELEEQEKVFMNQATQINAWDKLLIANGEKIVTLNQQVEKVKLEQQQLEHELDYVVGQQKELQDCLVPLEKELANISVSDPEREYTYRLSEKLDTQLKQMSEDLKEIIEHLNEANRAQDSSDPIVQIGKILNAHMNSLQWIDQRTSIIAQRIQQIDQMHQNFRQENERSFSLAYN